MNHLEGYIIMLRWRLAQIVLGKKGRDMLAESVDETARRLAEAMLEEFANSLTIFENLAGFEAGTADPVAAWDEGAV